MTIPVQKPTSTVSTYEPLLLRHPANPILTSKDWPYPINSVFNAGATLLADGSTLLLCRVEDRRGLSYFCAARSKRRSLCGSVRGSPVLSSHFSFGLAPQVGQRTFKAGTFLVFMPT